MGWLVVPVLLGIAASVYLVKSLNALLMGEDYAATMGIPVRSVHRRIMWTAGILAGTITAFCGPIKLPGVQHAIPLNAVTSLLGAPVVAWVLFSGKRWARST